MLKVGSLMARIAELADGGTKVGLLVIDEQESDDTYITATVPHHIREMQSLLVYAGREGLPVWLIELQPNPSRTIRTMLRVRGLLPPETPVVTKRRFNAFEGTDLLLQLQNAGVTSHLVVMGHEVNCCVRQTAIGGQYKKTEPLVQGATGNGYIVLTADGVLSINSKTWQPTTLKANWWDHRDVEYFTRV